MGKATNARKRRAGPCRAVQLFGNAFATFDWRGPRPSAHTITRNNREPAPPVGNGLLRTVCHERWRDVGVVSKPRLHTRIAGRCHARAEAPPRARIRGPGREEDVGRAATSSGLYETTARGANQRESTHRYAVDGEAAKVRRVAEAAERRGGSGARWAWRTAAAAQKRWLRE